MIIVVTGIIIIQITTNIDPIIPTIIAKISTTKITKKIITRTIHQEAPMECAVITTSHMTNVIPLVITTNIIIRMKTDLVIINSSNGITEILKITGLRDVIIMRLIDIALEADLHNRTTKVVSEGAEVAITVAVTGR